MTHGWIILDKPSGITSAHAVAKVKRLLLSSPSPLEGEGGEGGTTRSVENILRNPRPLTPALKGRGKIKIGHAGTLDPLASGILPLALGEATKTVPYMMDADKAYFFTVTWGEERDTDDLEGKITQTSPKRPTKAEIEAILPQFTGKILQTPPNYSAIKVDGERAYDLAREGQELALKAREVRVDSLSSLSHRERAGGEGSTHAQGPHPNPLPEGEGISSQVESIEQSSFICECGKGTYIRSLARDMGRILGCFGHVSVLRRLRVGKFDETQAISLESLEKMMHKGDLGFVRPVESALDDILAQDIDDHQAARLKRGQTVIIPQGNTASTQLAMHNGRLIAICEVSQGVMRPVRVFNIE